MPEIIVPNTDSEGSPNPTDLVPVITPNSLEVKSHSVQEIRGTGNPVESDAVRSLIARAYDLREGGSTSGYADIASVDAGGISFREDSDHTPSLSEAAALVYLAPSVAFPVLAESDGSRFGVWRVPEGTDITHWRVAYFPRQDMERPGFVNSNEWVEIGTDSGWTYYRWSYPFGLTAAGVANAHLQTDSTAARVGTSTFEGNLKIEKVLGALGLDLHTSSRGKRIQRKGDETGFEYVDAAPAKVELFSGNFTYPENEVFGAVSLSESYKNFTLLTLIAARREDPYVSLSIAPDLLGNLVPSTTSQFWYHGDTQTAIFMVDQGNEGLGIALGRTASDDELLFAYAGGTRPASPFPIHIWGIR